MHLDQYYICVGKICDWEEERKHIIASAGLCESSHEIDQQSPPGLWP